MPLASAHASKPAAVGFSRNGLWLSSHNLLVSLPPGEVTFPNHTVPSDCLTFSAVRGG